MTGHAMFNEVFLSDARVPDDAIIGGRNNGWAVANTTLMHERAGLGAGGGRRGGGMAMPGTVAGQLDRGPATSSPSRQRPRRRAGGGGGGLFGGEQQAADRPGQGQRHGRRTRPSARTSMRLHTMGEIGRYNQPAR